MTAIAIPLTPDQVANVLAQLPPAMRDDRRLRYEDGALVVPNDMAAAVNAINVDSAGSRLAPLIKAECGRRIALVLKDAATQTNVNSYLIDLVMRAATGEALTAEQQADVAMARQLKSWVGDMQDTARGMIAMAQTDYANDARWPAAPAGGRAFADRF